MTAEEIQERIKNAYPDSQVGVEDLTGSSNHWELQLHIPALVSASRQERHREIMSLFSKEIQSGEIHALSLKIK